MSDTFITVYEGTDPIDAEMLRDLLQQANLVVRVFGLQYASSFGAGRALANIRFEVAADQVDEARELIAEFFAEGDTELQEEPGDDETG